MELDMGRGHKENNRAGELNQQYFEQNIKISPGGPGNNISFLLPHRASCQRLMYFPALAVKFPTIRLSPVRTRVSD